MLDEGSPSLWPLHLADNTVLIERFQRRIRTRDARALQRWGNVKKRYGIHLSDTSTLCRVTIVSLKENKVSDSHASKHDSPAAASNTAPSTPASAGSNAAACQRTPWAQALQNNHVLHRSLRISPDGDLRLRTATRLGNSNIPLAEKSVMELRVGARELEHKSPE
jgi:hypothetical protein